MSRNKRYLVTLLVEMNEEDETTPAFWNWDMLLTENKVLVISESDTFDTRISFLDEDF